MQCNLPVKIAQSILKAYGVMMVRFSQPLTEIVHTAAKFGEQLVKQFMMVCIFPTLKKISKMCELEPARRTMERKVLTQPLSTAGPILVSASWTRLLRLPVIQFDVQICIKS